MSSILLNYEPFTELDGIFDTACGSRYVRQNNAGSNVVQTLRTRMNLHEDATNNTVTATIELPGVDKENMQIDVQSDRLRISGHEESGYAVRERRYGKFSRTLRLPRGVKEEQIKAALEGVLTLTFPKSTLEEAPKKVPVSSMNA